MKIRRAHFLVMPLIASLLGCNDMRTDDEETFVSDSAGGQMSGPAATSQASYTSLIAGFANPPASTRPSVYWYWVSGDISRKGIRNDLEAMAKAGIGEAIIGNVDVNREFRGDIEVLSDNWWDLVAYAMDEGARLGVDIGMFNSPGWSQSGGPWVKPEQSMRFVAFSETRITGPVSFRGELEKPTVEFQDIGVLAFPSPTLDDDRLIDQNVSILSNVDRLDLSALFDGDPETIFEFPEGVGTAGAPLIIDINANAANATRAIEVYPGDREAYFDVELAANTDDGTIKTLSEFTFDRRAIRPQLGPMNQGPVVESFETVKASAFRLTISNREPGYQGGVSDINITGAARLDRYVEKQLGKLWQTPLPPWNAYMWPPPPQADDVELTIARNTVVDLSDRLTVDGVLAWDAPEGNWTVVRFGMAPTNVRNDPASPEATGLEVDKMNADHLRHHFDAHIGEALRRATPEGRRAFTKVIADSYEQGAQNWTEGLRERFKDKYGYDPSPWLPVLTGRIVGSADQSERFLWDLRRIVADLISYEYVGALRDFANENGLTLWLENYGHWGFPGEFLQYGGQSDEVGGEFWVNPRELGSIEVRAAASAAHIYGKRRVSAEAFTTSEAEQFTLAPYDLKTLGDWAQTEGANHFVLHVYIHQPRDEKPGVNAWFGTEFNRHNTWFGDIGAWIDYLRRSHFLLQQGTSVADLAYFIGEDTPKMTGMLEPAVPGGYDFDFINAEVIFNRLRIQDGAFALPEGVTYKMLVLPPGETITPDLMAKLRDLVAAGGVIYGPRPTRSPSLENYPAADDEVRAIAKEMWGGCGEDGVQSVAFGEGKVVCAGGLSVALEEIGVKPDVTGFGDSEVLWKHRSTSAAEIYFVSNQSDETMTIAPAFRAGGRRAEIWDAVSGKRYAAAINNQGAGEGSVVSLSLAPRESLFVVFTNEQPRDVLPSFAASRNTEIVKTLEGPWDVDFSEAWGGPGKISIANLVDWTAYDDPRVQHFSGSATYTTTFDISADDIGNAMYVDLGNVEDIARVRLNGAYLGVIWSAPWRTDISSVLKAGTNVIEIDVTNGWTNRIIGDLKGVGEAPYLTYTRTKYSASSPLEPAGLIGPVSVLSVREAE
jgi:hypothetical protein